MTATIKQTVAILIIFVGLWLLSMNTVEAVDMGSVSFTRTDLTQRFAYSGSTRELFTFPFNLAGGIVFLAGLLLIILSIIHDYSDAIDI